MNDFNPVLRPLAKSPRFTAVVLVPAVIGALAATPSLPAETPPPSIPRHAVVLVEQPQSLAPVAGRGVALADFNGDRLLDAFVVAENTPERQGNRVYFGDGHGRFADSGQVLAYTSVFTHRPAVADVDGDGDLDVVAVGTVWLNDGHGHFTARDDLIEGGKPEMTAVGLADLDGNGSPDLLIIERWKIVRVYLNDGQGHFRDSGQRLDLGATAGTPVIGTVALDDVDGNGSIDAVTVGWRNAATDACPNRVWLNDGKGHFRDSGQLLDEGKRHVHGVAIGDLDGDGRPDIALALTSAGTAGKVYLNDGAGHFRDSGQKLGDRWTHAIAIGDFNGDGAPDLFLACGEPKTGTPNQVWLNDGKGHFADSGLRLGRAFSWDVALGDLDGDGRPDAFVANLRLADETKMPPIFGGAPAEVWLNTTPVPFACDYLGQPLPGATPEVFARGIVSTDDLEHSAPSFSPDGNEVFWRVNRRLGPANKEWLAFNMTMRRVNGRWSAPQRGPFESQLVFSVDGRRAYFSAAPPNSTTVSAGQPTVDVWCSERHGAGWSEPRCLNLVARYPELRSVRLSTTARSGTLYLEAYTPGPLNDSGIYRAEFINGEYAKPELLPRSINLPPFLNWTPYIAPDESYLLFSSNRAGSLDKYGDIYLSRRLTDGSWTEPVSLGEPVNSNRQGRFPLLSPDGKYLFFTRPTPGHEQDIYWVAAATIPVLRPASNPPQGYPK